MTKRARREPSPNYQPIENYGVVGDLHTVALVGMNASIDFMCFPEFDSPSIFAALLDYRRGGCFELSPVLNGMHHKQLYLPDSNILLTRFLSDDGVAEVSDFMTISEDDPAHALVRRAKTVRGDVSFQIRCAPRFDYGRADHSVHKRQSGKNRHELIFESRGPDKTVLRLRSEVPLRVVNGEAIASFKLGAGRTAAFILENGSHGSKSRSARADYVPEAFKATMNFWQSWIRQSQYRGRWREMVNRSALALKLLTSAKHGSIVAAPTFGLPEQLGSHRNWDYRYTWIRDASFSLYALMRLGYTAEASAFMKWIERRCSELKPGNPLQVMYALDGRQDLREQELKHFEGYRKSRPVRIGNGAFDQLQLDIYGELMDSVYIYNKLGELISYDFWKQLTRLIDWVCDNWRRPDHGVWEVRGGAREFLYSRVMCWVALDRGIRLAQKRSFPAPLKKWFETRSLIYEDVYENFWEPKMKAFVQYKGAQALDASALLMPLVKFIGPTDPRWLSTLEQINRELVVDSLVYRYDIRKSASTGFSGPEGTFSMCSFWNVECLARAGDVRLARFYFEKALGYANHLGLYSEELGPNGDQLGNFPQAFTHLALISAAYNLDRRLEGNLH